MLDQAVEKYVSRGYGVESRTETQVILAKKSTIGWFWNLLFTVVTAGLWLVVVLYRLINRKIYRVVLTIEPDGRLVETWQGWTLPMFAAAMLAGRKLADDPAKNPTGLIFPSQLGGVVDPAGGLPAGRSPNG